MFLLLPALLLLAAAPELRELVHDLWAFDHPLKVLTVGEPLHREMCTALTTPEPHHCEGQAVGGRPASEVRDLLRAHCKFDGGGGRSALVVLKALDQVVYDAMKDPTDFSNGFLRSCPVGAAALLAMASALSLLTNPATFEIYINLLSKVIVHHVDLVLEEGGGWGLWCALHSLATFALRPSQQPVVELGPDLGLFLKVSMSMKASASCGKFLYYTVCGGRYGGYLDGFLRGARRADLWPLVVLCEQQVLEECLSLCAAPHCFCVLLSKGSDLVIAKYAHLPHLLALEVGNVVWTDFDTLWLQNPEEKFCEGFRGPTAHRDKARMGSYMFDRDDIFCKANGKCSETTITPEALTQKDDDEPSVQVLVTDHWGGLCLNTGLFVIRTGPATIRWAHMFSDYVSFNTFAHDQNAFDSFLHHTMLDSFLPSDVPNLGYHVLDTSNSFISVEGWSGTLGAVFSVHFWCSDRVLVEHRTDKLALFELFFNTDSYEYLLLRRGSASLPEKSVCTVSAIGQ
jgi:hypothetical protein